LSSDIVLLLWRLPKSRKNRGIRLPKYMVSNASPVTPYQGKPVYSSKIRLTRPFSSESTYLNNTYSRFREQRRRQSMNDVVY